MDLSPLVLSHKRTSSKANNQNTEQPPPKQARQELPEDSDSSSSSSSDDEPPIRGVYIVQYSISEARSDANDSRIVGVYVSEQDALNAVRDQKRELIDRGAQATKITDLDFAYGWEWDDDPKIHICSYQLHPLIWPQERGSDRASEESSLGDDGIEDIGGALLEQPSNGAPI